LPSASQSLGAQRAQCQSGSSSRNAGELGAPKAETRTKATHDKDELKHTYQRTSTKESSVEGKEPSIELRAGFPQPSSHAEWSKLVTISRVREPLKEKE